mmetsp:Transcript_21956/g.47929  ORF Transcript_21956/g.47929 Transcript_21956/m.47929 type:complete len:320 (-) Transcript_21956:48-1007(-)
MTTTTTTTSSSHQHPFAGGSVSPSKSSIMTSPTRRRRRKVQRVDDHVGLGQSSALSPYGGDAGNGSGSSNYGKASNYKENQGDLGCGSKPPSSHHQSLFDANRRPLAELTLENPNSQLESNFEDSNINKFQAVKRYELHCPSQHKQPEQFQTPESLTFRSQAPLPWGWTIPLKLDSPPINGEQASPPPPREAPPKAPRFPAAPSLPTSSEFVRKPMSPVPRARRAGLGECSTTPALLTTTSTALRAASSTPPRRHSEGPMMLPRGASQKQSMRSLSANPRDTDMAHQARHSIGLTFTTPRVRVSAPLLANNEQCQRFRA